ncbi:hypothetical protein HD806DRAFT_496831 [Xylariaceae sp. AK1471]|nr:hypothetical protein HD806DRAFT_496831 [Xylariaceae sp. AK1471]
MPSFQKFALALCLALVVIAESGRSSSSPFTQSQIDNSNSASITYFQPTMYRVYPTAPNISEASVSQLEVQRWDNASILENIVVFEGIPPNAKTCTLGWVQAAKAERTTFIVTGNGLLAAQQLTRIPKRRMTWHNIALIAKESVEQGKPLLHPDTTYWPDIETQSSHIAGFVDCAEAIYLKIQIDDRSGDGYVFLGQDVRDGLTIEIEY